MLPRHAWTVVLLLALVVGLALAARNGPLPGDERLLRAWSSPPSAVTVINALASVQVWSVLVIVAAGAVWRFGQRRVATLLVLTDLSGEAVAFLVKAIVLRPRPTDAPLADALATASFPSGHVMRVAATLGILIAVWAWPRWRWSSIALSVGIVLTIGAARIASGEHWPSDVLASVLLAVAWVEIVVLTATSLARRPIGASAGR